jgi:hypothetical protein
MADNSPFAGNTYIAGSSPTSPAANEKTPGEFRLDVAEPSKPRFDVEQQRYGSGKPRRIIIRGKVSSD